MFFERRVVDNRTLLLGLDQRYRESIKAHESTELLSCARGVAGALGIAAAHVPIEGYYAENPRLTEYFRLVRALQDVEESLIPSVASLPEFLRLQAVVSAPLFGRPVHKGKLLPVGRDALSEALHKTRPWSLVALSESAAEAARDSDDISLVGLAARVRDGVALVATRESVVLYSEVVDGAALEPPTPTYIWEVDADLVVHARRFIETFNRLFAEDIPMPHPRNAEYYWQACQQNEIEGRCVRIGFDTTDGPTPHYHWAIRRAGGGVEIHEFWASEVWTTERYRSELRFARSSRHRPPDRPTLNVRDKGNTRWTRRRVEIPGAAAQREGYAAGGAGLTLSRRTNVATMLP